MGDWVLVKFPLDETGRLQKLSCPWHGPYRVIDKHDPDITVVKVYAPQDGQIQVHQSKVVRCPPELPAGFYWYGSRCSSSGRPTKWVDKLLQGTTSTTADGPELVNQSDATSTEDDDHPNPEDLHLNEELEQTSLAISTPQDNGDALGMDNWDQEETLAPLSDNANDGDTEERSQPKEPSFSVFEEEFRTSRSQRRTGLRAKPTPPTRLEDEPP